MMTGRVDRLRLFWANLHPWIRGIVLLSLAGVFFVVAVLPAYHLFKLWRLEANMGNAIVAVGKDRMAEARDLSLTVLQAGDSRIEVFRVLDESMTSLRDPRHAGIARALISHPEGSDEDRLRGFRGMVNAVALGLLGQAWVTLPESCRVHSDFAVMFADRLIAENRLVEATAVLLGVAEQDQSEDLKLRLIRILILDGKHETLEEAHRRIATGWAAAENDRSDWLDLLEEIPIERLRPDLLKPLISQLAEPGNDDATRYALVAARLEYAANPSTRADVVEKIIARMKFVDSVALARFLTDLGLHQRLLEIFAEDRIPELPGLFPYILGALEAKGCWQRVIRLLDARPEDLPKFEWLARRAVAYFKSGDTAAFAAAWSGALAEAKLGESSESLLRLRAIAGSAGLNAEADDALTEALLTGRGPLPLYADIKPLLGMLASKGRENILMRIITIYLLFEPSNVVLLTQCSYLACISELVNPQVVLKALKPMAAEFPRERRLQFVLATAYLCDGKTYEAAVILDSMQVKLDKITPGYRAVFLATQIANNRLSLEDPLVTEFPWKTLLPSELHKFREWTLRPPSSKATPGE